MSVKEIAIETISQLPEDADWENVRERIEFVSGIQRGLCELDRGKGIPVSEIEEEIASWISK